MHRIKKWATNRWFLGITAAVLLYALAGFLLVPFLVRHYTPKLAADFIKRQASIGEVHFNPFLFSFEAGDIALNEADGKPIAGLGRLFLDFDPGRSLRQRALVFGDLRLEQPAVNLVLYPDGQSNLARIGDSLPKSEAPSPPSDEPPPAVVLDRLALVEGGLKFTNLAQLDPHTETVEHLELELAGLSTLPDRSGNYEIEAKLPNGAVFTWKGDLVLNPVASRGELQVAAFPLNTGWNFIKDRLNLAEPEGEASLSARYQFGYTKDKIELKVEEAAFKLVGLGLSLADTKTPLLKLGEIGFEGACVDLAERTVRVPRFAIRKGEIKAAMDVKGALDWQALVKPEPAGTAPSPPTPPPPGPATPAGAAAPAPPGAEVPWKISVEGFEIDGIGLQYTDASRKSPFVVSVGDFGLSLGAEAEAGEGAPKAVIDKFAAHLDRLALTRAGGTQRLFGWESFTVEGGRLELEKQEVSLGKAVIKGGGTAIVREADGTLKPLDLFAPQEPAGEAQPAGSRPAEPAEPAVPQSEAPPGGKPWHVALGEFALQGFGLAFADRTLAPELAYDLEDIQVSVKDISNDGKTPVNFDARLKARQGGALQASGTASLKGDTAKAKLKIDRFNLKPLQAIVGQFALLVLESANFSTNLAVDFRQAQPKPSLKTTGTFSIDGLSLKDTKANKRFLSWKTLAVSGIDLSLVPDRLSVKEVRLLEPYSVIAIAADKSTNVGAVVKTQRAAPAAKTPAQPAPVPPAKAAARKSGTSGRKAAAPVPAKPAAEAAFPVTVGRVVVDKATIDFSDLSLVLPFATHIHDFGGALAGFSLSPKERATMKFEGRVAEYGEVKVDGSLSPLAAKDFSDIRVVFRNVAMNQLSPYSATFAGRKIESGKLDLDLLYKIDGGRLKSENTIVLQDFTLGAQVESPGATSLPLDLAIALLTDSDGRIKATVPIEGDVNDPKFAVGGMIWDAFVTLVKKVVTAPFNALAAAFGGSEEKLDAVLFEPGRDAIPPPEREKLKKIAEALAQRPKLKLTVHGRFDPKADGDALKSVAVRRALAEKLGVALAPGEEPDAVAYGNAVTQRALEKLAAERENPQAIAALEAEFLKESGKPANRIGMLGGLAGRASETPEFYEALFRHLVEGSPLPQSELDGLAARRGQAVLAELAGANRLDRSRLALGGIESTEEGDGGKVPTRLELSTE